MTSVDFLQPRFIGARFNDGEIPVDVLKDLVVLRDMILEQARWQYKEYYPRSSDVSSEFNKIDLKLAGIGDGSARPILKLATPHRVIGDVLPHQNVFEDARDRMVGVIGSMVRDTFVLSDKISLKALSYFNQLGKNLLEGELIEFSVPTLQTPVRLTSEVRSRLVEVVSQAISMQAANLRGVIHKIDQKNESFTMRPIYGSQISGPLLETYREKLLAAFNGYRTNTRIQIQCMVRNKSGQPAQIQSITNVRLLDQLDVPAQLDEMRSMKDGWLDGHGLAPAHNELDWLSTVFDHYYPNDAVLPYVCPTPEGGINMEWSVGQREIGLEINLKKHSGEWSWDDIDTGSRGERDLDLDKQESWEWIANQIRSMGDMIK